MDSNPISRATSLSSSAFENMLPNRLNDIARTQEQLTTGLRINRPSDDANGFQQARQLEILQQRFEHFEDSITSSRSWLGTAQNNLDSLSDVFSEIYQEGVRASNSTLDDDEREEMAQLMEQLLENALELLNSQNNNEYVFSGTRTSVKPFSIDAADPTSDGANVVYYGNTDSIYRQIGPNSSIEVNLSGSQVWSVDNDLDGTTDFTITESVQSFINALRANDVDAMTSGLSQIQDSRDHVINQAAHIGSIVNRLEISENQLADASIIIAQQQSEIEDTDFAETILEFQRAQTSLQTSLQVTSSVLQLTLLNFI